MAVAVAVAAGAGAVAAGAVAVVAAAAAGAGAVAVVVGVGVVVVVVAVAVAVAAVGVVVVVGCLLFVICFFVSCFLFVFWGSGHLRGLRLLAFFASHCQHNIGSGVGGGGGRWGRIMVFLACPHVRDAAVLYARLHFIHTLPCFRPSCASKHMSCYATVGAHAFPHRPHATLL